MGFFSLIYKDFHFRKIRAYETVYQSITKRRKMYQIPFVTIYKVFSKQDWKKLYFVFVMPNIRELMKDGNFYIKIETNESKFWECFKFSNSFLGNYKSIVEKMLNPPQNFRMQYYLKSSLFLFLSELFFRKFWCRVLDFNRI